MRHVLDLDGDWFAMPPTGEWCEYCRGDGWLLGEPDHYERGIDAVVECDGCSPPAVGEVLANVRMLMPYSRDPLDCPCGEPDHLAWADPPFVRVVEVLPIVKYGEHSTVGRYVVVQVEPGSDRAFALDNGGGFPVTSQEVALPGAVPNGWAVRVEPIQLNPRPFSLGEILHELTRRPPRLDGPPLNQEAQQ